MNDLLLTVLSMLGAFGFAVLFNVRGWPLLLCGLGGALCWGSYRAVQAGGGSEMLSCFVSALLVSAFALICARLLKKPATVFLLPSLIPLIPGGSLYEAISRLMQQDLNGFLTAGGHTLGVIGSLAAGIFLFTAVDRLIRERT